MSHRPSPGALLQQQQLSCSCPSGELPEPGAPGRAELLLTAAHCTWQSKILRARRNGVCKAGERAPSANTAVGQSVASSDQARPHPPGCELRAGNRRQASNGDKSGVPVKQNKLCTSQGGSTNLAGCPGAVCPVMALHVLCKVRAIKLTVP